jgi:hypothetical protein
MTLRQEISIVIIYVSCLTLYLILSPVVSTYLNGILTDSASEITPTEHSSLGVFVANLNAVFQGAFAIIGVVLLLYIFTHHWQDEPEQTYGLAFRQRYHPRVRRGAGSIFYILSFILTLIVIGTFIGFFDYLVGAIETWQTNNYPVSGGYYNPVIYGLWTQGWVWFPAMVFISLILGLWLRAHYRRQG